MMIFQNRRIIWKLAKEGIFGRRARPMNPNAQETSEGVAREEVAGEVNA
jgi:hypothetical protein